jgi:hypothetical protein
MNRFLPLLLAALASPGIAGAADDGCVPLFNGRDLTGWETCLAVPPGGTEPIGRGRDPLGVFQVVTVDGEPAIRISGEVLGGLATLDEYGDYHLELEFKWGERRFAPRADLPRDSGLLYHGGNGYNPATGWLESLEFGILEGGETGDFWSVPGASGEERILVDVEGEDIPPGRRRYPNESIKYRPGGKQYVGTHLGILNGDDNEKPRGQWNRLDLFCLGRTSVHVVNGTVNLVLTNARRDLPGGVEPLSRGRLLLQSEGAEVYFRRIRMRPIRAIPAEYLEAMAQPPPNTLTAEERSRGWRLLFDGESTEGWRGYRLDAAPAGWQVRDGTLTSTGKDADLITTDAFGDFELRVDWKMSHGGNSGIFYRVTEAAERAYESGPEFELRDHAFWPDNPYTNGANYGLHPPRRVASRPVGYWNQARILVQDNHVEHWLNGERVVSYELHSPEWQGRVRDNEVFRRFPEYGRAERGHIGLQNYGDPVWFRNIKIQ